MKAPAKRNVTKNAGWFWKYFPFWIFLSIFKFGAGLHFSVGAPLGERLLPLWIVGLLIGGGAIVQLLLDVPAGYLLDRYGYKRLLQLTTIIFLLAGLSLSFGLTPTTYIVSLIFSTFGWLFFGPGINAYILSQAPKEKAGQFISSRDVFESVGIVCSSAILPFVLLLAPRFIGLIIMAILVVAFVMITVSPRDRHIVTATTKIPTQHHYVRRSYFWTTLGAIKKLNPASTMLLLQGLAAAIFYGTIWFVVPLVIAHEVNSGWLGFGLGIFDFSVVVMGSFIGYLADIMNRRVLVFVGLLLFAIAGMLLGFHFGMLFLLFGFMATTGDELSGISLWSWLHSLDKEHARDGSVSGVINLFQDLGWAIGPILAGVTYGLFGAPWTILIGAVPIFLTWLVYQFLIMRHGKSARASSVPVKPHRKRHKS